MNSKKSKTEQNVISQADCESWLFEVDDISVFPHRMKLCAGLVGNVLQLSKRAELSYSGTRGYLSGSDPNRDNLSRIAKASGVRFEWLGEGTGPMREVPVALIRNLLDAYHAYCHHHSLQNERPTQLQFVREYNEGKVTTAENLHELLPKIAFVELRDWLAGNVPNNFAPTKHGEKAAPGQLIEGLYKDVGSVVEEYFARKPEKPSVAQILDYTVRAYQIVYSTGVRNLNPESKEAVHSLLRLLELGATRTGTNN